MARLKSYDRLFRENIEQLVVPLATRLLHLTIPALEGIPDDLQQATERKPGFLKQVVHPQAADNYSLHVAFQSIDDSEMAERMLKYYVLLYRNYHLPIKQVVFYIGAGTSQMQSHLLHESLSFQYDLISPSEVDHRLFVSASVPEAVPLAVLSSFQRKQAGDVIQAIVVKLGLMVPRSFRLKRYIKQLEILSNLRTLQELTSLISEKMPLIYDLEPDVHFKQGVDRRLEQGMEKRGDLMIETMIRRASCLMRRWPTSPMFPLTM